MTRQTVGLIGFGEVGQVFADDLATAADITAYDIRFDDPADPLRGAAEARGLNAVASLAEAAAGRDIVFSAVTAGAAEQVAKDAARHLGGAYFVCVNSVSPSTRTRSAEAVEAAGGRYVEAAVMAPIAPRRLRTPILLGGRHAEAVAPLVNALGFATKAYSVDIGRASAVKMCRSIFVKGLESIVSESMLASRRYGVEAEVLASFANTIPHDDWPSLAKYLITRTLIHGRRRSEEMVEVAHTIDDVDLPGWMSRGAVERQAWAADLGIPSPEDLELAELLDLMIERAARPTENGR